MVSEGEFLRGEIMTREDFREKAAGKYSMTNRAALDVRSMDIFIEGALFAYDFLMKQKSEVKVENQPTHHFVGYSEPARN